MQSSGPRVGPVKIVGHRGHFAFSQNFRKFRFGSKVENVSSARPTGKFPEKVENLKGRPVFPVGTFRTEFRVPFTHFNSVAILMSRRVTGSAPYRSLRSNATTFHLS